MSLNKDEIALPDLLKRLYKQVSDITLPALFDLPWLSDKLAEFHKDLHGLMGTEVILCHRY